MEEKYKFIKCPECREWKLVSKTICVMKGCENKRYKNNFVCKYHLKEMSVKNE